MIVACDACINTAQTESEQGSLNKGPTDAY